MKHRVFIYGTLKKGQYFHERYLGEGKSNFLGKAKTSKDYSLYIDGLPHMIAESSKTGVKGELYEVSDEILNELDNLEGHPVVYKREIIETYPENGERTLAWAYLRPIWFKGKEHAWLEEEFE